MLIPPWLLKATLWLSVLFNAAAATVFAFPGSPPGQMLGLPAAIDVVYATMTAYMIALFAGAYAWLALQTVPDRTLLCFGAAGKAGVFALACVLWLTGSIPVTLVILGSGELAFALLWFWWLFAAR